MARQLVLVAAAVGARGILEERFGELGILNLLYSIKPLIRFPNGIVCVKREQIGHLVAEGGDFLCTCGKAGGGRDATCCVRSGRSKLRPSPLPPRGDVAAELHRAERNQPVEDRPRDVDRITLDEIVLPRHARQQPEYGLGLLHRPRPHLDHLRRGFRVKPLPREEFPVIAAPGTQI